MDTDTILEAGSERGAVPCSLHRSAVIKETKPSEMVRASFTILRDAGNGLCKTLSEILVCPLSKQPLRLFS